MKGEIIAIGDELTTGRILNTTSSFAAGHLYGAGHEIIAMSTVGDAPAAIESALVRALKRADFIIVTGGLGATTDDMTNEAVAKVLARPTTFYPEIFAKIKGGQPPAEPLCQFSRGKKALAEKQQRKEAGEDNNHPLAKLAWLPEGSRVLKPEARMAGHLLIHDGKPIFFLPGVPREMRELMLDCVIPYLADWRGTDVRQVNQRIYMVFGLPEININQCLRHLEERTGVRIGYYPVYPEVHVSLTVLGDQTNGSSAIFEEADREITKLLGQHCFGTNQQTMESVVGQLLKEHNLTVALAESCTGGLVSHSLTRVPGSSAYFIGGVVAYANAVKEQVLGVAPDILAKFGAVSLETARAMALGIRRLLRSDIGLSVTGIAGPEGGTDEKPVGHVCFALNSEKGCREQVCRFRGDRWQIQAIAAESALEMVRQHLM
ncbi:MAG: CinA family nicotinamide mononucleotide deamidase-related protein [Deltaproteobacteria bacterium]